LREGGRLKKRETVKASKTRAGDGEGQCRRDSRKKTLLQLGPGRKRRDPDIARFGFRKSTRVSQLEGRAKKCTSISASAVGETKRAIEQTGPGKKAPNPPPAKKKKNQTTKKRKKMKKTRTVLTRHIPKKTGNGTLEALRGGGFDELAQYSGGCGKKVK